MSQRRRIPWKWIFLLGLFLAAALYFGGGLWGFGGGRLQAKLETAKKLSQDTPAKLREKIDSFLEVAKDEEAAAVSAEKREAQKQAEKLTKVMEAWAEDRYLATEEKVNRLIAEGKIAQAREELDSVPKEYWATKFGPQFEALKKKLQ